MNYEGYNELRMMVSIGQQPDLWVVSDTDQRVGQCTDVDAAIEGGAVVIKGDYQVREAFYAAGAMLVLPSGQSVFLPFDIPNHVAPGQWVAVNGTLELGTV